MSRKDYELIASIINERVQEADKNDGPEFNAERLMAWKIASNLGYELAQKNPGFNRERFLDACGF